MSDIEERLRSAHPTSQQYAAGSMLLVEAADEIERLRGRVAELESRLNRYPAGVQAHFLRKQSQAIDECLAQWKQTEEGKTYFTMSPGFLRDFAERLRREADEAENE